MLLLQTFNYHQVQLIDRGLSVGYKAFIPKTAETMPTPQTQSHRNDIPLSSINL